MRSSQPGSDHDLNGDSGERDLAGASPLYSVINLCGAVGGRSGDNHKNSREAVDFLRT